MIIAIIAVLGGFIILSFIPRVTVTVYPSEPDPFTPFDVMYCLIGESKYDPDFFYDEYGYVRDSDCTEYQIIGEPGNKHLSQLSEDMKFDAPITLDPEKYSIIISYGRKITNIEAVGKNGSYYILSITFEEEHHGNKAYFYQTNKMSIYLTNHLFIMKGSEKISYGTITGNMNEIDLAHPRRKDAK